ncbi:alpha amylase catalytic region [Chloroherpeton thalassium ATCC 35110]|uniref:Alpha amylase catalytic region n=1 Tax=Chloroherpeton thalassium (strain ATCC 35110 / GB-78) TaxID=517418 RepID=B3QUL1_CHLT3|nr:alpha-amylase family glycosyl hydrolase [Chloroherpeton thalassium]ACF12917.1 alpha amylase catalytic region [Chloroherpeton thalassium ATCC 35110]
MSLKKVLSSLSNLNTDATYQIPTLWNSNTISVQTVNPKTYFSEAIQEILATPKQAFAPALQNDWTKSAVIYNLFARLTTAFDHNGDGALSLSPLENGFCETGTFLKTIALLPYIKKLGVNTIHLLPITAIGHDGNKGSLGSPYAIKNPYKIDENLSEPTLGLDVETEFKAFVEACHHLGIRVVMEFVFRTMSKDGDWIQEHPDWFYWIQSDIENREPGTTDENAYGNPIFSDEKLTEIKEKVRLEDFSKLPPPDEKYRCMFTETPESVEAQNGRLIGKLPDGSTCKIPGAFADWPPDDIQPPWNDVTYLKMYDHPDFNYIAYNTIRMYDEALKQPAFRNKALWEQIIGIIPHYQDDFDIDGVMIDMGHALPFNLKKKLVETAREKKPDFAFWDENFTVSETSRKEGYNAVMGSLPFVSHKLHELKSYINYLGEIGVSVPFFGTAENHNFPRNVFRFGSGEIGHRYAKFIWALASVLPAVPFIHSGMEICESFPINTGLDFTADEQKHFPSEKLPLFNEHAYNWQNTNGMEPLGAFIKQILDIRQRFLSDLMRGEKGTMKVIESDNPSVFAVVRTGGERKIGFIGNYNFNGEEYFNLKIETERTALTDLFAGKSLAVENGKISASFSAGEFAIFEFLIPKRFSYELEVELQFSDYLTKKTTCSCLYSLLAR